jgi:hypothetical protein
MDDVKTAVASAIANALAREAAADRLLSWPVEIQRVSNLELLVTVRPVVGRPRRQFTVKISEPI